MEAIRWFSKIGNHLWGSSIPRKPLRRGKRRGYTNKSPDRDFGSQTSRGEWKRKYRWGMVKMDNSSVSSNLRLWVSRRQSVDRAGKLGDDFWGILRGTDEAKTRSSRIRKDHYDSCLEYMADGWINRYDTVSRSQRGGTSQFIWPIRFRCIG